MPKDDRRLSPETDCFALDFSLDLQRMCIKKVEGNYGH